MAPHKRADSGPPPTPLTKEYLERITQKELCALCAQHGVPCRPVSKESRILRLLAKVGVAVTGPIANWNSLEKAWQPPSKLYRKSWQRGADGKVSPSGEALLQRTFERYTKPPSAASLGAIAAAKAARAKAPPTRVTASPELPAVLWAHDRLPYVFGQSHAEAKEEASRKEQKTSSSASSSSE